MKKGEILSLISVGAAAFSLAACDGQQASPQFNEPAPACQWVRNNDWSTQQRAIACQGNPDCLGRLPHTCTNMQTGEPCLPSFCEGAEYYWGTQP